MLSKLKSQINVLKFHVSKIKSQINAIKLQVSIIKSQTNVIKSQVSVIKSQIINMIKSQSHYQVPNHSKSHAIVEKSHIQSQLINTASSLILNFSNYIQLQFVTRGRGKKRSHKPGEWRIR